jgi:hypothetical protein
LKDTTIRLKYDSEHLEALRLFMGQKGLAPETDLEEHIDQLFEKHVPRQVQEFLLGRPTKPERPPRPRAKPKSGNLPN